MNKIQVFEKILVLLDGSERSYKVAEYGIKIAIQNESKLYSLYIIDENKISKIKISQGKSIDKLDMMFNREAEKIKSKIKKMGQSFNKEIQFDIRKGIIINEISDYINENNINLLCMSHKIRTGSESFRSISIANQIIDFAQCPVFILQHK